MSEPIEIKYQEHDLDSIMRYFANGFTPQPDTKILRYEFTIDTFKRVVIFKLFIKTKPT